jgi:hypothetical protein
MNGAPSTRRSCPSCARFAYAKASIVIGSSWMKPGIDGLPTTISSLNDSANSHKMHRSLTNSQPAFELVCGCGGGAAQGPLAIDQDNVQERWPPLCHRPRRVLSGPSYADNCQTHPWLTVIRGPGLRDGARPGRISGPLASRVIPMRRALRAFCEASRAAVAPLASACRSLGARRRGRHLTRGSGRTCGGGRSAALPAGSCARVVAGSDRRVARCGGNRSRRERPWLRWRFPGGCSGRDPERGAATGCRCAAPAVHSGAGLRAGAPRRRPHAAGRLRRRFQRDQGRYVR